MPPFTIDISCHSVTEEPFDWFTQIPGSFRAFTRGLELLRESGLPFTLKTKAMNWNRHEIPAIRQFVESFGQNFGFTTSLSPRLNGELSSLTYRMAPGDVASLHEDQSASEGDEESCSLSTMLQFPTQTDSIAAAVERTIHINAWGNSAAAPCK
jgi:hypothetical protein